jgi:hypothetical protein
MEIEAAIDEASKARKMLNRKKSKQVTASDELNILKATALAWLRNHRAAIANRVDPSVIQPIDRVYQGILESTARSVLRSRYRERLGHATKELVALRSQLALVQTPAATGTSDTPPDFSAFVPDPKMQAILSRRWEETLLCVRAGAYLAATVMMGGLLEALFLARLNKLTDKRSAFNTKGAPKDDKGKNVRLQEWTLRHYIDVGHELTWITQSAKTVSEVLRDYRNYIHPQKEFSHGIELNQHDAEMFWEVTKSLTRQILASA